MVAVSLVASLCGAAFFAGIAVGKAPAQPRFTAVEEVKWEDMGGSRKLAALVGDPKKGAHGALLKVPGGSTTPLHSHTGAYEAVQIQGTSSHWLKGEDGTKAKKMTPGSYWTIPAKVEHVSACATGADCLIYRWQKTKFDVIEAKLASEEAVKAAAPMKK